MNERDDSVNDPGEAISSEEQFNATLRRLGAIELPMSALASPEELTSKLRAALMGEVLPGDEIDGAGFRPATVAEALALIEATEAQWPDGDWPEVGDIVEATERITIFTTDVLPGQRCVVTTVLIQEGELPVLSPNSTQGFPYQPHTIALAIWRNDHKTGKPVLVEHLHDHRNFVRVGTVYDDEKQGD